MSKVFQLAEALKTYELPDIRSSHVDPVTGPAQLLYNLKIRELVKDEVNWGTPTESDIFVFSEGEPADRSATKCGGIPYWERASPWPTNSDGQALIFLGQINFSQSTDLVGKTPGNLLTIFGDDGGLDDHGCFAGFLCIWQKISEENALIECLPNGVKGLKGVEGHRCRISQYPDALPKHCPWHELKFGDTIIKGAVRLSEIQGTQIFGAQAPLGETGLKSPSESPIASLSTICPAVGVAWPWVDHQMKIDKIELDELANYLQIGDLDCLDIAIDQDGNPLVLGWC